MPPPAAAEPKWLKAVNLDLTETEDGEPVAILGFLTEEGQHDYLLGRGGAHSIIQALTNFLDVSEGRPPTFPTKQ